MRKHTLVYIDLFVHILAKYPFQFLLDRKLRTVRRWSRNFTSKQHLKLHSSQSIATRTCTVRRDLNTFLSFNSAEGPVQVTICLGYLRVQAFRRIRAPRFAVLYFWEFRVTSFQKGLCLAVLIIYSVPSCITYVTELTQHCLRGTLS